MTVLISNPDEAAVVGHHASIVLNQIRYWLYKANKGQNSYVVQRFGCAWLACSRDQLGEQTALSKKQLRSALETLKANKLIVVEQHLFQGKNVSHFRAAREGYYAETAQTKKAKNGVLGVAPCDPPELAANGHLIKYETELKTKGEYGALDAPLILNHLQKEKKEKASEANYPENSAVSVPEVKPTELASLFRKLWDEEYPGTFLPDFESKDLGQVKNLIQRCPDGLAPAVVEHAVRNWSGFCSYATWSQGAFNMPEVPHLGTLLRFLQSAVNSYLDYAKSSAENAEKASPA